MNRGIAPVAMSAAFAIQVIFGRLPNLPCGRTARVPLDARLFLSNRIVQPHHRSEWHIGRMHHHAISIRTTLLRARAQDFEDFLQASNR
ncbi:hypothetical protein [Roseovarius sp.]|uniref:hypothetical protein n=1 Tax=Roseovarius sp. TaxID=1486281 RepID=UPI003D0BFD7A